MYPTNCLIDGKEMNRSVDEPRAVLNALNRTFNLKDGNYLIGRNSKEIEYNINLDDPSVDVKHAILQISQLNAKLIDIFSINGTKVNSQKVPAMQFVQLEKIAQLQFGEIPAQFRFVSESDSGFLPQSPSSADVMDTLPPSPELISSTRRFAVLKGNLKNTNSLEQNGTVSSKIRLADDDIFANDSADLQDKSNEEDELCIPETQEAQSSDAIIRISTQEFNAQDEDLNNSQNLLKEFDISQHIPRIAPPINIIEPPDTSKKEKTKEWDTYLESDDDTDIEAEMSMLKWSTSEEKKKLLDKSNGGIRSTSITPDLDLKALPKQRNSQDHNKVQNNEGNELEATQNITKENIEKDTENSNSKIPLNISPSNKENRPDTIQLLNRSEQSDSNLDETQPFLNKKSTEKANVNNSANETSLNTTHNNGFAIPFAKSLTAASTPKNKILNDQDEDDFLPPTQIFTKKHHTPPNVDISKIENDEQDFLPPTQIFVKKQSTPQIKDKDKDTKCASLRPQSLVKEQNTSKNIRRRSDDDDDDSWADVTQPFIRKPDTSGTKVNRYNEEDDYDSLPATQVFKHSESKSCNPSSNANAKEIRNNRRHNSSDEDEPQRKEKTSVNEKSMHVPSPNSTEDSFFSLTPQIGLLKIPSKDLERAASSILKDDIVEDDKDNGGWSSEDECNIQLAKSKLKTGIIQPKAEMKQFESHKDSVSSKKSRKRKGEDTEVVSEKSSVSINADNKKLKKDNQNEKRSSKRKRKSSSKEQWEEKSHKRDKNSRKEHHTEAEKSSKNKNDEPGKRTRSSSKRSTKEKVAHKETQKAQEFPSTSELRSKIYENTITELTPKTKRSSSKSKTTDATQTQSTTRAKSGRESKNVQAANKDAADETTLKVSTRSSKSSEDPHVMKRPSSYRKVRDVRVCLTRITDKAIHDMAVKKVGLQVVNSPRDCDVLVTESAVRTYKFLAALARGIPIVTPAWLTSSTTTDSLPSPDEWIVRDRASEKKYNFSLKNSLQLARGKPIFEDYKFVLTPSIVPPPSEMIQIIECGGGKILENPSSDENEENIFIVSCKEDVQFWRKLRQIKSNLAIISTEGIMTSVLYQEICFKNHLLSHRH